MFVTLWLITFLLCAPAFGQTKAILVDEPASRLRLYLEQYPGEQGKFILRQGYEVDIVSARTLEQIDGFVHAGHLFFKGDEAALKPYILGYFVRRIEKGNQLFMVLIENDVMCAIPTMISISRTEFYTFRAGFRDWYEKQKKSGPAPFTR